MTSDAIFLGVDVFGTRTMLLQCALLAMRVFGLALTLFLSVLMSRLIAVFYWSSSSRLLLVWILFWKGKRKPPNSKKTNNYNIRHRPAHPTIFWKLPLLDNECKRGKEATNEYNNMRFLTAPCKPVVKKGLAKAKFRYKLEFISYYNIYWKLTFLHNDRERRRQECNKSISFVGEQQFLSECGLLPNSVLCGPSQSHSRLRGSVGIFGDPKMVPQMVSEVHNLSVELYNSDRQSSLAFTHPKLRSYVKTKSSSVNMVLYRW